MDVKKYFTGVFVIESRVGRLKERIEELRARQTSSGGLGDDMAVRKSRNYRQQEEMSIKILEMEEELAKEKLALLNLEIEVKAMSQILKDPLSRAIITWRYICRLKWKDIADRAEISEMQAIREHNAALEKVSKCLEGVDTVSAPSRKFEIDKLCRKLV